MRAASPQLRQGPRAGGADLAAAQRPDGPACTHLIVAPPTPPVVAVSRRGPAAQPRPGEARKGPRAAGGKRRRAGLTAACAPRLGVLTADPAPQSGATRPDAATRGRSERSVPPPGPLPRLPPAPCPLPRRGAAASPTRRRKDAPRCLSGSSSSPAPRRQGAVPGASALRPAGSGQAPHEDAQRPRGFLRREAAAQSGRGGAARSTLRAELLQQHRVRKASA